MTKFAPATFEQLEQNVAAVNTNNGANIERLRKAYALAREAHKEERRESGELYIEHDLAIAIALSEIQMDVNAVIAGLLHDIDMPHTSVKLETARRQFGQDVFDLLNGMSKLDPYTEKDAGAKDDRTLERIRRAILSIVEGDPRIIMIRLADVLQDIRKASELPAEKRLEIAADVRNIYAPIANRLGVWHFKWELEDLSFRYLQPEEYREVARRLAERRSDRNQRLQQAIQALQKKLAEAGLKAEVSGRPKHIYSIYRKMKSKDLDFEQIYDVRALRVILPGSDPNVCYQALGLVHALWQPVPQEFDDYIARPKPNGYRSLHTAVRDEDGQTLEVQIRTAVMHRDSELGMASAHWIYKESGASDANFQKKVQFLRQLLEPWTEADNLLDPEAFKSEIMSERIYVFTPRGDLHDLPLGSTPIDFAYQIHSEIGHRCRGAKVNSKMVTLDHKLQSGDTVEIITASRGGPNREWMSDRLGFTGSARTRSKIRQWFRQQDRQQNIQQGREMVLRELRRLGVSDLYDPRDIAEALEYSDTEDFFRRVGFGDISLSRISGTVINLQQKLDPDDELLKLITPRTKRKGLTVTGVSGLETKLAGCCQPIPPMPITGYVTRGRGVTIHRANCPQLLLTEPERWIDVDWGEEEEPVAVALTVYAYSRISLSDKISYVLRQTGANLIRAKTVPHGKDTIIQLVIEVTNLDQFNRTREMLGKLSNVYEVARERSTRIWEQKKDPS